VGQLIHQRTKSATLGSHGPRLPSGVTADRTPLRGGVISGEPTSDAPFGYWIMVNELMPAFIHRQMLHYRSATHHSDGNPMAVMDSEMPNIEQRLGIWRPGMPLFVPASASQPCRKPHLSHMELWCD
jgi:hypothetical protein